MEKVNFNYAYKVDQTTDWIISKVWPIEWLVSQSVKFFKKIQRANLLGSAVLVGPDQFPKLDKIRNECAEILGIDPPSLYVVNSAQHNAATYGTQDDAFIIVNSRLVDHFSDEELKSVIGHECGHIHNKHVVYLTLMHNIANIAGMFFEHVTVPSFLALKAWGRNAEITADRAAVLCTNEKTTIKAFSKLALGSIKLYDQLNIEAYMRQYDELRKSHARVIEIFASHPYLPRRVEAIKAFCKSKQYLDYIGQKSDEAQDLKEIDSNVSKVISIIKH
jgi:Zn-dependent protease with chaperone function